MHGEGMEQGGPGYFSAFCYSLYGGRGGETEREEERQINYSRQRVRERGRKRRGREESRVELGGDGEGLREGDRDGERTGGRAVLSAAGVPRETQVAYIACILSGDGHFKS